ncbi:MAG: plasmid partition protein ParG [Christensenellales bacterium]
MGRPPIQNPKSEAVHVRLDSETVRRLSAYCTKHGIAKTEAIRQGIEKLLTEENEKK